MNKEAFSLEAVSAAASADTLRFLTCGSVDDGKSTLIGRLLYDSHLLMEDQVEDLKSDSATPRHDRRRDRLRASRRRPRGGARAGHHDRRRLPLLRHAAPPLHRRRHARPRPVHAQHGDRRLDRRSRHPARRCDQGAADPDAPPRDDRLAARHPRRGAGGEQDGSRRLRRGAVPRHRGGLRRVRRKALDRQRDGDPDLGARRRQRLDARARGRRTIPARFCSSISRRSRRSAAPLAGPFRMPVQWVCRPNAEFPRLCRAGRSPAAPPSATRSWSPLPAARAASPASCVGSEERESAVAGQSAMLTLADEVDVSRGDLLVGARRPPAALRPVRRRSRLDGFRAAAPRPAVSPEEHDAHRAGAGDRAQIPLRRRHARAQRREGAGAERDRLRQSLRRRADRLRSLCREPRDRRLHPDRPLLQPDGRRRHDPLRAPARLQHPLAGALRRPRGARAAEAPEALRALVHRPLGLRQIDRRQPRREAALRAAAATPPSSTATTCATA